MGNDNLAIETYNTGYCPAKSEAVTIEMVHKYITEIDDSDENLVKTFLLIKVYCLWRSSEIDALEFSAVNITDNGVSVKVVRKNR